MQLSVMKLISSYLHQIKEPVTCLHGQEHYLDFHRKTDNMQVIKKWNVDDRGGLTYLNPRVLMKLKKKKLLSPNVLDELHIQ